MSSFTIDQNNAPFSYYDQLASLNHGRANLTVDQSTAPSAPPLYPTVYTGGPQSSAGAWNGASSANSVTWAHQPPAPSVPKSHFGNPVAPLPDGRVFYAGPMGYAGKLLGEKRHGQGTLRGDCEIYTGGWKVGKKDGAGIQYNLREAPWSQKRQESQLRGLWEDGKLTGVATQVWEDGSWCSGQFSATTELLDGKGVRTGSDGSHRSGKFKNGLLDGAATVMSTKGLCIKADGTKLEAPFKADLADGKGTKADPRGYTQHGYFYNDGFIPAR